MTQKYQTSRLLCSLALVAAPFALTGCMNQLNDRGYLGVDADLVGPNPETPRNSTNALNRDQWATTTVYVPVDGTAHSPTYNSNRRPTQMTARQRGEFPRVEQALELEGDSLEAQVAEVPIALGRAIIDAVSIPGGLVIYPQTLTRWSPDVSYERIQRNYTILPGSAEATGYVVPSQMSEAAEDGITPSTVPSPAAGSTIEVPSDVPQPQSTPQTQPQSTPSREPIGQMTPVRNPA